MNKSMLQFVNKLALVILCIIGLIEFVLALWTILEDRYKSLAYNLADVGYIVSFIYFAFIEETYIDFYQIGSMDIAICIDVFVGVIDYNLSHVFNFNLGFIFSTCIYIHCDNDGGFGSYCRIDYINDHFGK